MMRRLKKRQSTATQQEYDEIATNIRAIRSIISDTRSKVSNCFGETTNVYRSLETLEKKAESCHTNLYQSAQVCLKDKLSYEAIRNLIYTDQWDMGNEEEEIIW